MKVILRSDVENLGRLGDLVEVKAGYGRNFLLPQGLAMAATPSNLKVFELERRKLQAKVEALRSEASNLADKLTSAAVRIAMRVGENDKLYGSVTSPQIADALAAQGIEIERRRILLDAPIRSVGEHTVRVRLHADVVANLVVSIVPERAAHAEEETPAQAPEAGHADEQPAASEAE